MLGGLLGGSKASATPSGGGLNNLLGGVLGGGQGGRGGLGGLLKSALNQFGHSEKASQDRVQPIRFEEHSPDMVQSEANDQAEVMIKAIINAAK